MALNSKVAACWNYYLFVTQLLLLIIYESNELVLNFKLYTHIRVLYSTKIKFLFGIQLLLESLGEFVIRIMIGSTTIITTTIVTTR